MIYLLLAIASSSMIAILMRFCENKIQDRIGMFLANYLVCTLLSAFYMRHLPVLNAGRDSWFCIGLGVFGGVVFLLSFVLYQVNISKNGVVLASTFMKLGVLVPIVMAIVAFHEKPTAFQIIGVILAIVAILIINGVKSDEKKKGAGTVLLILLLLVGGFTDSLANIYDKSGAPELKDQYLFFIFLTAAVLCAIILIVHRHRPTKDELLWGAIIGIPNYFSSRFLLLALGKIAAIVTYPVYNIAVIFVVGIVGVLAFREILDKRKGIGMAFIIVALILLNI